MESEHAAVDMAPTKKVPAFHVRMIPILQNHIFVSLSLSLSLSLSIFYNDIHASEIHVWFVYIYIYIYIYITHVCTAVFWRRYAIHLF